MSLWVLMALIFGVLCWGAAMEKKIEDETWVEHKVNRQTAKRARLRNVIRHRCPYVVIGAEPVKGWWRR